MSLTPTPTPTPTPPTAEVTVWIDPLRPLGTSQLAMGVTHTQYSLDGWGDPNAVASGKQVLQASTVFQNQHLMGWGADTPEPSPGVFNWASLDSRVQLMRDTGGTLVLTLCGAPDWMKGGAAGSTDWSKLDQAPTPRHYGDYAKLARRAALRYPDIRYFQVWNELKGFYNGALNRWDYEGYTAFYNQVYDAVKAVRPDARIGGPYVVLTSETVRAWMSNPSNLSGAWGTMDQRPLDVLTYWLAHKHGADFVCVDTWTGTHSDPQPADWWAATTKFADATAWLRQRTDLPIWWSEWYTNGLIDASGYNSNYTQESQNAMMAVALIGMAKAGAAVQLKWQPQGMARNPVDGDQESLWSDTRIAGGGQPFPYAATQQAFKTQFPPGTPLYQERVSSNSVVVLAGAPYHPSLVVNTQATPVTVSFRQEGDTGGAPYTVPLHPYEVRVTG
jgi:hypothetical protein